MQNKPFAQYQRAFAAMRYAEVRNFADKNASVIPFTNHSEIRREAADLAVAQQGEATTYRHDLEMEQGA
ncbi:hypothetical protein [Polaromonas sp. CG9_12]|nr:hypothetical protein [Polaromonas sp. CG9_12]